MRITLREVAAAAGVSVSAASRALQNRPGVGAATRQRVLAEAERLGWQPDPLLSALASYRQRDRRPGRICIVHLMDQPQGPYSQMTAAAVAARAGELGYQAQTVMVEDPRLLDHLAARKVRGVILQVEHHALPALPWDQLAAVQLLGVASGDGWPVVAPNHVQDVETALTRLTALGYRRPALMLPAWYVQGPGRDTLGAWHAFAGAGAVPEPFLRVPGEDAAFIAWWRAVRPDCLLYQGPPWPIELLRRHGVDLPREAGFISLDLLEDHGAVSGIWSDRPRLGKLAVDLLHARLAAREWGLLQRAPCVAVGGTWCAGTTLPQR